MVEKISKKILNILSDEKDDKDQKEILLFGITRIVEDIPKYIGILLVCLLLGALKEFLIVMAVIMIYKTFTGGVHLHTNIGCFIGSLISIMSCIYIPIIIAKYQDILIPFAVFIYIFSIYIILVYVPADVPEIPIINKKRRKRDKIMAFIALNILYLVAFFLIENDIYLYIILTTILNIDVMTTRLVYKIFKNKYGHETYVPDELLL